MKIAIITYTLARHDGGITSAVVNFYQGLKQKTTVDLLAVYTPNELQDIDPELVKDPGVKLFVGKAFWRYSASLKTYLETNIHQYDICHIHGIWVHSTYVAAHLALKYRVPFLIAPHGMVEKNAISKKKIKKKFYWALLQKKQLQHANALHCISESEENNLRHLFPQANCLLIPNGVQVPEKLPIKEKPSHLVIGFLGRFHPIKGLDRLIMGFDQMQNQSTELWIAGGGTQEYTQYINDLVAKSSRRQQIKLLGFIKDKEKDVFLKGINLLAVTSFTEGLSLAVLEALSNGVPLLMTAQCNFHLLTEYHAGVNIPDNDPLSIAKGLDELTAMNLADLSQNAWSLAHEQFDLPVVADILINHFYQLCKPI